MTHYCFSGHSELIFSSFYRIQHNRLHHSKRSGVVVLGSGRGTIKANDIYQNREAGIYILFKGDPYVR